MVAAMVGSKQVNDWPIYYILVGRTPFAVDAKMWAREFQKRQIGNDPWRVAYDKIDDHCYVSTVFLGINHNWRNSDPVLFETMVFGGPLDLDGQRYCTYDDAERGHAEIVAQARIACARVKAIADATGAKK